jgi:2-(1,2-epoxy-1,2-dihydrophenyl)acetyl-CoA isomerase
MEAPVLLERHGAVALLRLNRPKAYNAANYDLMRAMCEHMVALAVDEAVRAVVLTGQGKAFCSGGDLKWMLDFPGGAGAGIHALAAQFHQAVVEIRRMPKAVIAAINGVAAGGGFSLALACDFRVMAESAVLRQAYTAKGLSIDGGGTFTLPRLVGLARALEIAAFDEPISAAKAVQWGLVTTLAPDDRVVQEAMEMAHKLTQVSTNSLGFTKQLLLESFDTPLESQLERERIAIQTCAMHPDGREGLAAFSEKRKPVFHPA